MSLWCIPKLFHMHNQYIRHTSDWVLQILIWLLAGVALHLHSLRMTIKLDTLLKTYLLLLPGVFDCSRKRVDLYIWTEWGITLRKVYPIDINPKGALFGWPDNRNILVKILATWGNISLFYSIQNIMLLFEAEDAP